MAKLKICGLKREEDIKIINLIKPDYAGFIINFPKSHRNLNCERVAEFTSALDNDIKSVGVIVNQPVELPIKLLQNGTVDLIQLHGNENEDYIKTIKETTGKPVIKAFTISSVSDVLLADKSPADFILLDKGQGSGEVFDWSLLKDVKRDYFLAGGLNPNNLREALELLNPFGVDLSSGVETDKLKDSEKILAVKKIIDIYNN